MVSAMNDRADTYHLTSGGVKDGNKAGFMPKEGLAASSTAAMILISNVFLETIRKQFEESDLSPGDPTCKAYMAGM